MIPHYSYFFDIHHKKDLGIINSNINQSNIEEELNKIDIKIVMPLIFQTDKKNCNQNVNLNSNRVLMIKSKKHPYKKLKLRVCNSLEQAKSICQNIIYMYNTTKYDFSGFAFQYQNIVISDYINGSIINRDSTKDITKVAKTHAKITKKSFPEYEEELKKKLYYLIDECCNFLSKNNLETLSNQYKKDLLDNFPTVIIPVFDHQDIGINNIIKSKKSNIYFIDEEAFGLMPFGYSLHKACSGKPKYKICTNDKLAQIYINQFPKTRIKYYLKTIDFWDSLLRIRMASKYIMSDRKELGISILEKNDNNFFIS